MPETPVRLYTDGTPAPKRIGIYGGTFDPVHNAHLDIARAALESAHLDKVLFVVAARPPHKRDDTYASPEQRLAMVEAALEGEPRMEACGIELDRDGPSYTGDTVVEIERICPGAKLFLIIGMDSLIDLPNWRDPGRILSRAHLLVVPRPGNGRVIPESLAGKYDLLPFDETDVSSTDIRGRIQRGASFAELVPPAVERVIRDAGIYHARV